MGLNLVKMVLKNQAPAPGFHPGAPNGDVARVPFHFGGLGIEGVFARRCVYVRNRSQPSAITVCNCPRDCYMAVPMVSSAGTS